MSDDLLLPATTLRDRLASRQISSVELLEATMAQIGKLNPRLNAIIHHDARSAYSAALACDQRIAQGTARPLEGLPICIKDSFEVADMPATSGAVSFKDHVPTADAVAVARLRNAGAVILGKSNVPIFTGDFQSFNALHGTSNNPWDLTRSPGGSSGGAAAAVATGMSAFELGSDIGGSIRWPAHACGLFGLKPTWDLVPTYGHLPPKPDMRTTNPTDLMVAGPITRSAGDADMLLHVLAGPLNAEGPAFLRPPRTLDPRQLRIAVWVDEPDAAVDAAVRVAVLRAADILQQAGAVVSHDARPAFAFMDSFVDYALLNHAIVAAGLPDKIRARLVEQAGTLDADDVSHQALQIRGAALAGPAYSALMQRRKAIFSAWAAFFEDYDAILVPPAPVTAIAHDHKPDFHARQLDTSAGTLPYFDFLKWASLATLARLPAMVAPVMRAANGMPAGVQIICAQNQDRMAIAIASIITTMGGGFAPPPIILQN